MCPVGVGCGVILDQNGHKLLLGGVEGFLIKTLSTMEDWGVGVGAWEGIPRP